MHRFTKICCVLLLALVHSSGQAQTAFLQSKRIFEGDIAQLVIEHDSKIPSLYALDLSALEVDFKVLEVRSQVARVVEADEIFHRMQWKIEILPRRSGSLRIPSIIVGAIATPVLGLEVARQSPALLARQKIFLEVEAQPQNPYVGQPVRIVTRLLHNLPIFEGNMLEPEAANTQVHRREDSRYVINRHGQAFNVLERSIVLVAQSSGVIELSPASYRGLINTEADATVTSSVKASRRIYRASAALQLQVREPPPEFSGNSWLPARQLEISRHWDEISGGLTSGDTLGFSLIIEARGLPAEALPAGLIPANSAGLRIYADQAVRSTRYEGNVLLGRLEQRFAVVVSQPGEITIPATVLKWWDVTRDSETVALLGSRKFTVINPVGTQPGIADLSRLHSNVSRETTSMRGLWLWLVLVSLLLTACASLFFITSLRHQLSRKIESVLSARRNRQALKKACMTNDPLNARRELLRWGRRRWPDANINGIYQIEARAESTELLSELARLDRALYAQRGPAWQGRRLWRLIAAERRYHPARPDAPENSLPNLYPRQNLSIQ